MAYLIAGLVAATVGLLVMAVAQAMPARPASVGRRLEELEAMTAGGFSTVSRRQRQSSREQWEGMLRVLGERIDRPETDRQAARSRLVQAGYHSASAPAVFWGIRIALPFVLFAAALTLIPFAGTLGILAAVLALGFGWLTPSFYVDYRIRRRQGELRRALPDAVDLLVTAVEAGLGLNQAIVRVAQEARHISSTMAEELALVNLEIRAGKSREDALRALGERTGLDDLRSLAAMLIQTDRFGTSIAQALRVHSDTMRVKRRQRAEEAAAKTTVKILFPLLLCIFPALFVVIIGPAAINIYNVLVAG